jgi:hypothetical protein
MKEMPGSWCALAVPSTRNLTVSPAAGSSGVRETLLMSAVLLLSLQGCQSNAAEDCSRQASTAKQITTRCMSSPAETSPVKLRPLSKTHYYTQMAQICTCDTIPEALGHAKAASSDMLPCSD